MPLALAIIAIVEGIACAMAFVKMDGIDILTVLRHYITFSSSPRIFLWQSFAIPNQRIISQEKITIQKAPTSIKIEVSAKKDHLKLIRDYLETQ